MLQLAAQCRSDYAIVVSPQAGETELFAAQELQKYLRRISGVTLPLVRRPRSRQTIRLGSAARLAPELGHRESDAFIVRTCRDHLLLAGASPRATLYAVYGFLEDVLGCAWLKPGDEQVPQRNTIRIASLNRTETPDFTRRMVIHFPCVGERLPGEIDWMAKVRLNESFLAINGDLPLWDEMRVRERILPELRKRGMEVRMPGHAFAAWLPPSRYLRKHPDWFALIDGQRHAASLCISNPAVAREVARNIRIFADANPEVRTIALWHNDCGGWCQCPTCRSWQRTDEVCDSYLNALFFGHKRRQPLRTPALTGAEMRFVNAVAERVAETHPHVMIETLAYGSNYAPSREVTPHRNVLVGLALFEKLLEPRDAHFPITSTRLSNRTPVRYLREWWRQTDRLYVYEYFGLFHDFSPLWDVMQADFQFYQRNGIREISSESATWNELHMGWYAKLAWNCRSRIDDGLRRSCRAAYGVAGDTMLQFWQTLRRAGLQWDFGQVEFGLGKVRFADWDARRKRDRVWKRHAPSCERLLDEAVRVLTATPLAREPLERHTNLKALDRVRRVRSRWTEPPLPWFGM